MLFSFLLIHYCITNCFSNGDVGVELGHGLSGHWPRPFASRSCCETLSTMHGLLVACFPSFWDVHATLRLRVKYNCVLCGVIATFPVRYLPVKLGMEWETGSLL